MSEQYLTIDHFTLKEIVAFFSHIHVSQTRFYNNTPCWEWTAAKSDNGYGITSVKRRTERAHRVMFAWLIHPIPRGLGRNVPQIDHLCQNVICANPVHLDLKLPRDNNMISNSFTALNARKTHCVNGHEFTPSNTYKIKRDDRRICRTCTLARQKHAYDNDAEYRRKVKSRAHDHYKQKKLAK